MIGQLNHVAIAVPDLKSAVQLYRDVLGAQVSDPVALPEHGVTCVFVDLGNSTIELLEPLGSESPIRRFLDRNPDGGIHHICLEVDDIQAASDQIGDCGLKILGSGTPRPGAHGNSVIFLHPKDFLGTLVELEQSKGRGVTE